MYVFFIVNKLSASCYVFRDLILPALTLGQVRTETKKMAMIRRRRTRIPPKTGQEKITCASTSALLAFASRWLTWCFIFVFSAVEEEGVGAADEPEEAEGEEVEEDEGNEEDEESSEDSSSSEESGAEDEGADDEGPEDEEEAEEGVAALPISKEQQEAEEEDLGKVC